MEKYTKKWEVCGEEWGNVEKSGGLIVAPIGGQLPNRGSTNKNTPRYCVRGDCVAVAGEIAAERGVSFRTMPRGIFSSVEQLSSLMVERSAT